MYAQLTGFVPNAGKLILTFHGSEIVRFSRSFHQRPLLSKFIKHADKVHFLSKACRDMFLEFFQVEDDRIAVLPGAPHNSRQQASGLLNLPDTTGKVVCLTVGRVHPRKGQHTCIDAMRRLPEELRSRIQYWIVGPVVDKAYFQSLRHEAAQSDIDIYFIRTEDILEKKIKIKFLE